VLAANAPAAMELLKYRPEANFAARDAGRPTAWWRPRDARPWSAAAVIAVTHDERMTEGFDRVYHMVDGRIDRSWWPSRPAHDGDGVVPSMAHA